MRFLKFASIAVLPLMLGACGNGDDARYGQAQDSDAAANDADATSIAGPEDVTTAGFPFLPGRYIEGEDCEADEPDFRVVDFTPEYSQEYGADGDVRFSKIVQIGEGHYRISEEHPAPDGDDGSYPVEADYIAQGENGFRRVAAEDGGTRTETFQYCAADTAIGRYGQDDETAGPVGGDEGI